MLDRNKVIQKIYDECLAEMYAKAQPSVDYWQLIDDVKTGKISKGETVYDRYYLSKEEFDHILNKYVQSYKMEETWEPNIELLEQYLTEGGTKDKYVESHTDEDGHYHPGYRGYEKVKPIKEQIQEILKTEIGEGNVTDTISNKIIETVLNTISDCKEFYRFDREETSFKASIALGPSPTSNKDTVIEYWKSQGIDIEIVERNPLLLWEHDYYGDNFEEMMIDEYGDDWEKQFNDKWDELKRQKEEEKREWEIKYQEMINKKNEQ